MRVCTVVKPDSLSLDNAEIIYLFV